MTGLALPALLGLSFSAGVATFFAPCAFPLLLGYLSYFVSDTVSHPDGGQSLTDAPPSTTEPAVNGLVAQVRRPLARAALLSTLAGLGMTLVYVGLAGTTAFLGAQALADIAVLEVVVGSVFLIAGGAMATGWKPPRSTVQLPRRERSLAGFFVFGVLYAAAAAGCTAPLFIAVVLQGVSAGPILGVGAAVSYALGMSTVLAVVTGVTALGGASVTTTLSAYTGQIYRIAGGLLAASGVADTVGYSPVTDFDTPGCRKSSRSYSQQYEIYYFFYGFPEVLPQ